MYNIVTISLSVYCHPVLAFVSIGVSLYSLKHSATVEHLQFVGSVVTHN